MSSTTPICLLCDKDLVSNPEDIATVKARGLQSIRRVCYMRNNEALKRKLYVDSAQFHKNCNKSFMDHNKIAQSLPSIERKLNFATRSSKILLETPPEKQVEPELEIFDSDRCIFCLKDASDYFLKKETKNKTPQNRIKVCTISNNVYLKKIRDLIKGQADEPEYDSTKYIFAKFQDDTLVNKARYHYPCQAKFFKSFEISKTNIDKLPNAVKFILNFVKEHEDVDFFKLQDLISTFAKANPNENLPVLKTIKKHLKKRFDETIFIASNKNQDSIIFRQKALKVIWY